MWWVISEIVMRAFGWRGDVVDDFSESVSGQGARC